MTKHDDEKGKTGGKGPKLTLCRWILVMDEKTQTERAAVVIRIDPDSAIVRVMVPLDEVLDARADSGRGGDRDLRVPLEEGGTPHVWRYPPRAS